MIKPIKVTFNKRAYVYRFHGFTIYSKTKLTYGGMRFKYNEALRALSFEATEEVVGEEELAIPNQVHD
jgi:hypothetical protein